MKANIKKGDVVMVITGDAQHRDKTATVVAVDYDKQRVTIEGEGAKKIKKHIKPKRAQDKGGITEQSGTVHISNVMPICAACGKPTRVGHKEIDIDGKTKKVRVCVKCGAVLETPKASQAKNAGKTKVKKKIARKSDKETTEE
ncbi:MAG: 50S ribosomal protein L24 [Clostridiales bacterium]|jgi:large subunit ribosomal protein L24|nr:50S ribosomal protein L24 [Clostridiales bacterium]